MTENPILNGRMEVCQNPALVTNAPDGTEICDRWVYNKIGGVAHTISQDNSVPSIAAQREAGHPNPRLLKHCYRLTLTTPDNTISATEEVVIVQKMEGSRFAAMAQTPQKVGFLVSSTLPGTFSLSFRNDVPDISCVVPVTVKGGGVWEWKELDLPPSPANGTWCYDNTGCGLRVGVVLAAGSNFHAPFSGNWVSGYFHAVAGQTNFIASGNTEFRFTDFQIYPADQGPYAPRFYEDELRACRRIRRRYTGIANTSVMEGAAYSASQAVFTVDGMRKLSSVSFGGTPALREEGTGNTAITSMSVTGVDGMAQVLVTGGGGLTIGRPTFLRLVNATDYIEFNGGF